MHLFASLVAASMIASGVPLDPQGAAHTAPSGTLSLRWSELSPVIQGQRVAVSLADGRTVRGDVMAVRDEALVLDVTRGTSNADGTVPRASVTTIRLKRTRGAWGRQLGTTLGVLSGLTISGYVTAQVADGPGAGIPLFLGIASAITVGGYYAGKELDQKETTIQIVP